jgi:hypothetical protein
VVCPGGCTATPSGTTARIVAPTHPPAVQVTYRERVGGEVLRRNMQNWPIFLILKVTVGKSSKKAG